MPARLLSHNQRADLNLLEATQSNSPKILSMFCLWSEPYSLLWEHFEVLLYISLSMHAASRLPVADGRDGCRPHQTGLEFMEFGGVQLHAGGILPSKVKAANPAVMPAS